MADAIVKALDWLLGEPKRGAEILGAIQSEATLNRIEQAKSEGGEVLRESAPVVNEMFPDARVASPLIIKVDHTQQNLFLREMFGPIVYLVATKDTDQGIALAAKAAREIGAITFGVYSTSDDVLARAEDAAMAAASAHSNAAIVPAAPPPMMRTSVS